MSYARDCVCAVFECPCHFGVFVVVQFVFVRVQLAFHEFIQYVKQFDVLGARAFIKRARDDLWVDLLD